MYDIYSLSAKSTIRITFLRTKQRMLFVSQLSHKLFKITMTSVTGRLCDILQACRELSLPNKLTDQELLEQLFGEFADIKIIHWEINK